MPPDKSTVVWISNNWPLGGATDEMNVLKVYIYINGSHVGITWQWLLKLVYFVLLKPEIMERQYDRLTCIQFSV